MVIRALGSKTEEVDDVRGEDRGTVALSPIPDRFVGHLSFGSQNPAGERLFETPQELVAPEVLVDQQPHAGAGTACSTASAFSRSSAITRSRLAAR